MEKLIIAPDGTYDLDNISEDVANSGNWWYFHGKLQDDIGYDKGLIMNIKPNQLDRRNGYRDINLEGEYEVEIIGIEKPCIGFFWIDNSLKFGRGLVCYKDDIEAIKYAKNKMKEREDRL